MMSLQSISDYKTYLRQHLPAIGVAIALGAIFLLALWVRMMGLQPDKLLSFDPIFQLRFTEYVARFGTIPEWDELGYYVGRAVAGSFPPLIFYLTSIIWKLGQALGWTWTLKTAAGISSAFYGAAIVLPAFFLARSLSNKLGGLLAAVLVGTAPQILIRTFGASFDTDQIAIFFIILTMWLGWRALRNRTVASLAVASASFIAFAMAWPTYWFTAFIIAAVPFVWLALSMIPGRQKPDGGKVDWPQFYRLLSVPAIIFAALLIGGTILQIDPISNLFSFIGFAQSAEQWIVNISIAELQLVDLGNLATWQMAIGRFVTGVTWLDSAMFFALVVLTISGLLTSLRHERLAGAFMLTIVALSIFTVTRGIRFTEFSSAILLVAAGVGFGNLVKIVSGTPLLRSALLGLGLLLAFMGASLALQMGPSLAADTNSNWDAAYAFLRSTPETSLVGTWWDPGHMITGLAERRVIADGAHCGNACLYTINDRITDLGRIFTTSDEQEAVNLLQKYKGTSDRVYWIASDDLIGKFQWLQYFGTGCDARSDANCPLYSVFSAQSTQKAGNFSLISYGQLMLVQPSNGNPFTVVVQGRTVIPIDELLAYVNGKPTSVRFNSPADLEAVASSLNLRTVNQTASLTVWLSPTANYAVVIPQNLRQSMFTKMFFLEGQGLNQFKQVFTNDQIKIYELDF
jgi:dolichyl-diphosphooligosaccharide--protein glycosyltransferase